jgi:hypothetical protein
MQVDAGHPSYQGGGQEKGRAEEEERHKGSLAPKK